MSAMPRSTVLPERWFRTLPDSSVLSRPRLLARSLIDVRDLDRHIAFYEELLGVSTDLRMPIPDFGGLELAAVGNLLLIASERPFTPIQMQTAYSLIVPSLDRQLRRLQQDGTTVLEPIEAILPGSRARVQYPDGSIAELVQHRPRPGEGPRPPSGPRPERDGLTGVRLVARREVPSSALEGTIAMYEDVLESKLEARAEGSVTGGRRLALVGNLLLVGADTPAEQTACVPLLMALLTPSPEALCDRIHQLSGVMEGQPAPAADAMSGDGSKAVTLLGGAPAEVWNVELLTRSSGVECLRP